VENENTHLDPVRLKPVGFCVVAWRCGRFSLRAGVPPTGLVPYSAALADMDGDGDLDAVTVDLQDQETGTVSVSRNDGSGGFSAPVSYPVGAGSAWLAVSDLNHDARPDVVVSNS